MDSINQTCQVDGLTLPRSKEEVGEECWTVLSSFDPNAAVFDTSDDGIDTPA